MDAEAVVISDLSFNYPGDAIIYPTNAVIQGGQVGVVLKCFAAVICSFLISFLIKPLKVVGLRGASSLGAQTLLRLIAHQVSIHLVAVL